MTSATSRPTATERGVNSRIWDGFCGPGDDMRRIVCGLGRAAPRRRVSTRLLRGSAPRSRAPGDEPRHRGLVGREPSGPRGAPPGGTDHVAVEICLEDGGVHVALAAHGHGVAEAIGRGLDRLHHRPFRRRCRRSGRRVGKRARHEHRARPGAEVLGGERLAARLAHVVVDVGRVHRAALAPLVHVLKELVAGQVAARLHDPRDARVAAVDAVDDAALAAELEGHARPVHLGVGVAQRGQSVRAVRARVLFVADPDQRASRGARPPSPATFSRGSPARARSAAARARSVGSAAAN